MSDELHYLSATEAIAHFRARELSPVELLQAIIDRTQNFEPHINAFTEEMFDEALAGAREAESRYLGHGPEPRPLEGIPVAAKEKHAIAGKSLTEGSLAGRGNIARENAPVIDRLLAAGGLIHARTTTPEFCVAAFTHSPLWGVTRNPWNLDYSPGGSSGGAGAALAAGTTTLATASDIGGSTRGPAGFTGTVGLKASYGRIAGVAPLSMDSYRGDGPMARTVDDAILLANVLIGPDPRDHSSLRPAITLPRDYPSVEGMRIALCLRLGDFPIEPDIEANTRALAQSLVDAGAIVEEIELPWTRDSMAAAVKVHFGTIMGASVAEVARAHGDLLADYTLDKRRDHVEGRCGNVISGGTSQRNPDATRACRGDGSLRCADLPDFGHHRLPGRRVFARRPHCGGSAREHHRRSTSHFAVQRRQSVSRTSGAQWTRTQRRSHGRPDRRPYVRRTDRVPDRQSTGEDPARGHTPTSINRGWMW